MKRYFVIFGVVIVLMLFAARKESDKHVDIDRVEHGHIVHWQKEIQSANLRVDHKLSCETLVQAAKAFQSTDFMKNGKNRQYLNGNVVPAANGVFRLSKSTMKGISSKCSMYLGVNLLPQNETNHCSPNTAPEPFLLQQGSLSAYRADPFLSFYDAHMFKKCVPYTFGSRFQDVKFDVQSPSLIIAGQPASVVVTYDPPQKDTVLLSMRLVGPSIVTGTARHEDPRVSPSPIIQDFLAWDPGMYILEILLVDIHGDPVGVTHMVYQGLVYVMPPAKAAPDSSKICTGGVDRPGRWVYVDSEKHEACPHPLCGSDTSAKNKAYWKRYIFDELRYNFNYIWTPWDCHYHFYTSSELTECWKNCGYKDAVSFSNVDSLGREILFNVAQITSATVELDGRKFKANELKGISAGFVGSLKWNQEPSSSSDAVYVYAPPIIIDNYLRGLTLSEKNLENMIQSYLKPMDNIKASKEKNPGKQFYINLNSLVVYTNPRDATPMPAGKSPSKREVIDYMIQKIRKKAQDLGLNVLNTRDRTASRWFSSHDGIHFTMHTGKLDDATYQWTGGASHMNAVVLLNLMCNRPCNGYNYTKGNKTDFLWTK
jgi:hypothetical protein